MDDKKNTQTNIQAEIESKIASGEVSMKPKMHFTLHIALLVLASLFVLILSVGIANFILFSIRISGHEQLLGFGGRGVLFFLSVFPWHLLLLDIIAFLGLLWLLKQFRIGYRSPVVVLLGLIVLFTAGASIALDRGFRVNDRLIESNGRHPMPRPLGFFYKKFDRELPKNMCLCEIVTINGNELLVQDIHKKDSEAFIVRLPQNDIRATTTGLSVGDVVMIASDSDDGEIRAFGVRKADDSRKLFIHFEGRDDDSRSLRFEERLDDNRGSRGKYKIED